MPPKRKSATTRSTPSRKRRRVSSDSDSERDATARAQRGFGADEDDDLTFGDANSVVSYSTRTVPTPGICQSLSSLAVRVAANDIATLFKGSAQQDITKALLLKLPEHLVSRLFAQLRVQQPTLLSHTLITTYFLRGDPVVLNSDLPGVSAATIAAIPRRASASTLRGLELIGFSAKILSDDAASKLLAKLPALERLVFRDCKAVGPLAVASASKHCPKLVYVNLSSTQATTDSIVLLVTSCTKLETLKLASIPHLSKTALKPVLALVKAAQEASDGVDPEIASRISNLKLRAMQITPDTMYRSFLSYFPNLRRLDLSHTNVHFNLALCGTTAPRLEKLSIYNTPTSHSEMLEILPHFASSMRTLNIAHLGGASSSSFLVSAGTLGPTVLRAVTDELCKYEKLERLTISPSVTIPERPPRETTAMADFIRRVGRKCKFLDLGSVRDLKATDLVTLVPEPDDDDEVPALEHLVLSNTKVDDDAAPFISACHELRVLDLESTIISSDGIFQILSKCEKLAGVNVTGCRRIRLQDRRRIFEAWEVKKRSK